METKVPQSDNSAAIESILAHFKDNQDLYKRQLGVLRENLSEHPKLKPFVHSMKWRMKEADNLKDKLIRKGKEADDEGRPFDITIDNLSEKVTDLIGFRIIHLHTREIEKLDKVLRSILDDSGYKLIEGPIAHTWDEDATAYFSGIKIETKINPRMYTSVHYVVQVNTKTKITCEIQVRTLAEELWGEVDHMLNYPKETEIAACRDQIKVLARFTSGCSRLVDSIFDAFEAGAKE
jgi:ppGpp synthetase/RelA/SpoT-type nucleotidyltranferase